MNSIRRFFNRENRVSLKTVFSIDLRSLALMRISLALLILIDLLLRVGDISEFYTDQGVLPRKTWIQVTHRWYLSLHSASGELWWQVILFAVAAVAALLLLIGYRTRLMTIISWLLLSSLLNRNLMVLQGGDLLLVIMCFWAMFLPLGARWSVDSALQSEYKRNPNQHRFNSNQPQLYFSMATVAVIFQVLFLYFFTALLKTGAPWRFPFEASLYTVNIQHFATPIAMWLKPFEGFLQFGAGYVIVVEFLAPLIVLLPFAWPHLRLAGLAMLASLHVAFLLMLHIGLFPLIDFMSLLVLLPSAFWIFLSHRRENRITPLKRDAITLYYDEDCGFCLKMCLVLREFLLSHKNQILPAQAYPDIYAIMERENSWVITDGGGKHYTHWGAMQHLFVQKGLFKPIGWLMRFPPLMLLGDKTYRWIADNRNTMGDITAKTLPYRELSLKPRLIPQLLAAFCFYVVVMFNLSTLPDTSLPLSRHVDYSSRIMRIDQKWSMFAPKPLSYSLFPQIEGDLRDGTTQNIYKLSDIDPDWNPPAYGYPVYENYRWRKYFDRLRSSKNDKVRSAFGSYQCQSWNRKVSDRSQQLGIFTLHYIRLNTNLDNLPRERFRNMAWRHWCFAEFKPK